MTAAVVALDLVLCVMNLVVPGRGALNYFTAGWCASAAFFIAAQAIIQ